MVTGGGSPFLSLLLLVDIAVLGPCNELWLVPNEIPQSEIQNHSSVSLASVLEKGPHFVAYRGFVVYRGLVPLGQFWRMCVGSVVWVALLWMPLIASDSLVMMLLMLVSSAVLFAGCHTQLAFAGCYTRLANLTCAVSLRYGGGRLVDPIRWQYATTAKVMTGVLLMER